MSVIEALEEWAQETESALGSIAFRLDQCDHRM